MASIATAMSNYAHNTQTMVSTVGELEKRIDIQDKIISDLLKVLADSHPELLLKYVDHLKGLQDDEES